MISFHSFNPFSCGYLAVWKLAAGNPRSRQMIETLCSRSFHSEINCEVITINSRPNILVAHHYYLRHTVVFFCDINAN